MIIDFAKYSINEQIKICASAWAIIGCEGAAFVNQIFMEKKSLIIAICYNHDLHHIPFQSTIAKYMNHEFNTIPITNTTDIKLILNNILSIVNNYYNINIL